MEKFERLQNFGVGIQPVYLPEHHFAGLRNNFPVMWKDGTCEYQGISAGQLIWLNVFLHKEEEHLFKEIRCRSRKPLYDDIMVYFFWQLESLGMLGYV